MEPIEAQAAETVAQLATEWGVWVSFGDRDLAEAFRAEVRRLARRWRIRISTTAHPTNDDHDSAAVLVAVHRLSDLPWDEPIEDRMRRVVEGLDAG